MVNAAHLGNAIIKGGKVDALVAGALQLAHNTEAYRLARQITSGELNQNSGNLGELLASYSKEGGDISFLTELPVEKGRLAATREKVQAKFEAEFEAAKERAGLLRDILGARLDLQTARTAMRTYNEAVKSRPAEGQTATAQMRGMLRTAGNQKAQMNAELNVAKTEAILRLRPLHTAMKRAMQAGDFAAFLQMKDRYQQGYALEQAKHRAARADMQSRAAAIDTGIKSALAAMQERFGPAEGGELESAGAQGYVNTVGEATGTEGQGQVGASVDGGDGGILGIKGNGDSQGLNESGGQVNGSAVDYIKRSAELENQLNSDGYRVVNVKMAKQANEEWARRGYTSPPVAEGTQVYNVEAGNHQYARVYYSKSKSRPKSPFLLRADDIKGLTAEEIANKYALPQIPDKIVYPRIPPEILLEVSIVGEQEFNGIKTFGGNVQYTIKDVMPRDEWFLLYIEDLE